MTIDEIKEDLSKISRLESTILTCQELKQTLNDQNVKFGLGGKVGLHYGINNYPFFAISLCDAYSQLDMAIGTADAEIYALKQKHNITE